MLNTASKTMPASTNTHPDLRQRLQIKKQPRTSKSSKLPGSSTAWESKVFKVEVTESSDPQIKYLLPSIDSSINPPVNGCVHVVNEDGLFQFLKRGQAFNRIWVALYQPDQ